MMLGQRTAIIHKNNLIRYNKNKGLEMRKTSWNKYYMLKMLLKLMVIERC